MAKEDPKRRPEEADLPRNFTITTAERMRALAAGPPAFARRRRSIESLEATIVRLLVELEAEAPLDIAGLPDVVVRDIERLNELIDADNRYYPIEANLRIDLRTRRFVDWGEPREPMPRATAEALLAAARRR